MPFGMVSGVSRMMGVFDGVVIVKVEEAVLGVNLGRPTVISGDYAEHCSARVTHSSQITLRTCYYYLSTVKCT